MVFFFLEETQFSFWGTSLLTTNVPLNYLTIQVEADFTLQQFYETVENEILYG